MAIGDDFTINWGAKTVEHTAGTSWYHVNELYSWLQGEFDELSAMDDTIPMKALTPTVYEWQNGWTLLTAGGSGNGYEYLSGGSVASDDGDELWANLYSIGSQVAGTNIYIIQDGNKVSQWWGTDNIDILLLVKVTGAFIDNGNVRVFGREFGDNYDHNDVSLSGGGRNVVGINTADDSNNDSDASAVSGYGLTWEFGLSAFDLNNGAGAVNYSCWIDCNGNRLSAAYEQMKYETARGATGQDFYLAAGVSGDGEQYTAASSTFTAVKTAPFGTFAGGKFFGARGVWIYNYHADDSQNFQLLDSSNTTQAPPNTVAVKVTSLLSGDRVLVAATSAAGAIDTQQYEVSAAHDPSATTLTVSATIQTSSTPQSGWVRVADYRHQYSSWSQTTSAFTLTTAISAGAPGPSTGYGGGEDVYVPLIDWEVTTSGETANTMIQSADLDVVVRVRRIGIIPFQTTSQVLSNGMTVGAIRVTDTIVSGAETSGS